MQTGFQLDRDFMHRDCSLIASPQASGLEDGVAPDGAALRVADKKCVGVRPPCDCCRFWWRSGRRCCRMVQTYHSGYSNGQPDRRGEDEKVVPLDPEQISIQIGPGLRDW